MQTLLTITSCLALLLACNSPSDKHTEIDFSKETVDSYAKQRKNKDSAAIYHEQKVAYLNGINLHHVIPDYLKIEDRKALLIVTAEGCIGCTYMREIMDSIAKDYPTMKLLEFTPNQVQHRAYFHPTRFMGINSLLADTLLSWGYPRIYFIKNDRVQEFTEGGPSERTKLHYLKNIETIISTVFNVPNKKKDLVIESEPYEGSIYFDGGARLSFTVEKFDASKNTLDTCDSNEAYAWICKINGQKWFGQDHSLVPPSNQLTELAFTVKNISTKLETSGMYNVNYQWVAAKQFKLDSSGSKYILSAGFSDGAGYYEAEWEIENGIGKRVLLSNDEADF